MYYRLFNCRIFFFCGERELKLNLLNFRAGEAKEQELVTFGIPENIIRYLKEIGTNELTVASNNGGINDWGLGILI